MVAGGPIGALTEGQCCCIRTEVRMVVVQHWSHRDAGLSLEDGAEFPPAGDQAQRCRAVFESRDHVHPADGEVVADVEVRVSAVDPWKEWIGVANRVRVAGAGSYRRGGRGIVEALRKGIRSLQLEPMVQGSCEADVATSVGGVSVPGICRIDGAE